MFILGITGCILAFETELRSVTEPYRDVQPQQAFLPPSQLKWRAEKYLSFHKALSLEYPGKNKAAIASYYDETNYELVFLDPYSGRLLKHKDMNKDFFRFILDGHFYLWLPHAVGQFIACSATLIFVIMMITGIVLWWPKNKAARRQRFSIKWNASWRRKNYDLHNVGGFYMCFVAIFIALTGLVFGFQWVAKSVYWITSGGTAMADQQTPVSNTTKPTALLNISDSVWAKHARNLPAGESLAIYFAGSVPDAIQVIENHRPGTYYNSDTYYYDQFTGKPLNAIGIYAGKFADAKFADKVTRMNYDLHVGAALGLAGKILAFFASLLAASLPITGFMIWWGKRKKKRAVA